MQHPDEQLHPFLQDQRLRKLERLRKRAQFLRTQRAKRRSFGARCSVYIRPNELPYSRIGITTSRKVGNAVRRNRWKRLIRESYRKHKLQFPQGYDIVFIVKPKQQPTCMQDVLEEISSLSHKALRAKSKRS